VFTGLNLGRVVSGGPWNPDHATVAALFADARGVAADCEAGKYKAEACAACHGEKGISPPENTPSLAGQPDQFLQWQLIFFCGGMRKYGIHGAGRYCGYSGRGPDRLSSAAAGLGDGEVATAPGQEASRSIYRDRFLAAAAFLTGISEIRQWWAR